MTHGGSDPTEFAHINNPASNIDSDEDSQGVDRFFDPDTFRGFNIVRVGGNRFAAVTTETPVERYDGEITVDGRTVGTVREVERTGRVTFSVDPSKTRAMVRVGGESVAWVLPGESSIDEDRISGPRGGRGDDPAGTGNVSDLGEAVATRDEGDPTATDGSGGETGLSGAGVGVGVLAVLAGLAALLIGGIRDGN